MTFLGALNPWHWWVLGVVLMLLEIAVPGVFFFWGGLAALGVGMLLWAAPGLGWEWQLLWFAVFLVASVSFWRLWWRRHPPETDQPLLNRRGAQYVGREVHLTRPIRDGFGETRIDDTVWRVSGPDLPGGARVRIVGVEGNVLCVEPTADAPPRSGEGPGAG